MQLPDSSESRLKARLLRRCPNAVEMTPPPQIARAVEGVTKLLAGEKPDLDTVELDMSDLPDFNIRVYEIARAIPPGQTLTYGDIAFRLGDLTLSRAVGQALG